MTGAAFAAMLILLGAIMVWWALAGFGVIKVEHVNK
jgi:hypothetical protein